MEIKSPPKSRAKAWIKRIGFAGFLFFLIKGIIWIAVFVALGMCS